MARSVELTPPPRRASPSEEEEEEGIRAVNPSPAGPPAMRVLRLSTRAQTPSQQRSLSWALVKDPTAAALSSSLNPTMADQTPPTTTKARQKQSRRVASEPMLSKLYYTSRTATSHRAWEQQQVNLSPLAASTGSRRTFDFHRATKAALASSGGGQYSSPPHPHGTRRQVAPASPSPAAAAAASSGHHHLPPLKKTTSNHNHKKKTRTPRKAPSNFAAHPHPHPPSLVKSMLGLAARAVKAFSTARGRRRSILLSATAEERDKLGRLTKRRSGLEPEWTDDDAHDNDGQEAGRQQPGQSPRTNVSPRATAVVKKRTRVSNGSARSRLAREEEEADTVRSQIESAPRTPRIGSSTTKSRRQKVGTTTSSSAKRHPSSSGGGASTFRASSSRKRVRVGGGGGRPSLPGSISGRTIYPPSSVFLSHSAILNRARPVSRSEALVGEYTARAILRSSVNGGGVANELLRSSTRSSTTSDYHYHYYRPRTGEIGGGETEEEEEWVEEARVDEFGAPLPALGHDAQIRESEIRKLAYIARLDQQQQQQGARGRFHRSLAPSPISVRTVVRNPIHSRAVNSEEQQQQGRFPSRRNSSVLSLGDLSHRAVADESQVLDDEDDDDEDNSASSPLLAFVRQLATAAAQSSSQDGDVEDSSAGGDGGGGGLDSPTPTSTSDSEAAGPFSSSPASRSGAFRLPEWLPFASAAAEWTRGDQSSEDENGDDEEAARAADDDSLPSPFEDASEDVSDADAEEGAGAGPNTAASMRRSPLPRRRRGGGPTASPLVLPRQVDSADLASARLIGAKRLSREPARTASLAAVLKRSNSTGSGGGGGCGGGNGSAPVSPTSFGEDALHETPSPPPPPSTETSHLTDFVSANATESGGRIGLDLSQETLRPTSLSSRLPSLSPVSPFKFRFASESSPAAATEDAIDPSSMTPPPVPNGGDLRHSYRELTRGSADFTLPSSRSALRVSAAAMRETALEVFGRVPPAAAAATPPLSGADSNSNQQALRRTIRPGDDASLGRTGAAGKKNGGAWEIYRDEVVDESNSKEDRGTPSGRSGAETSEAEAGVLAERTEASMLRKLASRSRGRGRGGDARAWLGTQQQAAAAMRSSDHVAGEEEGEKENVRGYFSA